MLKPLDSTVLTTHYLPASARYCTWGYIDPAQPACLSIEAGERVQIDAISHHAGDAPELMLDEELARLWSAIPPAERSPGVHILSGPIEVRGAEPGMALAVQIGAMSPRHRYGSNAATHWGLLYDEFPTERITIYGLEPDPDEYDGGFSAWARPEFAYEFTGLSRYKVPGFLSRHIVRQEVERRVRVPVRPHLGVVGVAPGEPGRRSSIPPGPFGGNVDNWRFGPGSTVYLPVFTPGAGLYVGDPHFAQGDGEICGTAIEASATVDITVDVVADLELRTPLLETAQAWHTHGFGPTLDAAMRQAAQEMVRLIARLLQVPPEEAYSIASVAADLGITQVVDGTIGAHATIAKSVLAAGVLHSQQERPTAGRAGAIR